jgi:hypothetical protein
MRAVGQNATWQAGRQLLHGAIGALGGNGTVGGGSGPDREEGDEK